MLRSGPWPADISGFGAGLLFGAPGRPQSNSSKHCQPQNYCGTGGEEAHACEPAVNGPAFTLSPPDAGPAWVLGRGFPPPASPFLPFPYGTTYIHGYSGAWMPEFGWAQGRPMPPPAVMGLHPNRHVPHLAHPPRAALPPQRRFTSGPQSSSRAAKRALEAPPSICAIGEHHFVTAFLERSLLALPAWRRPCPVRC